MHEENKNNSSPEKDGELTEILAEDAYHVSRIDTLSKNCPCVESGCDCWMKIARNRRDII